VSKTFGTASPSNAKWKMLNPQCSMKSREEEDENEEEEDGIG